ncbi:MAG TPA: response regulator [Dongiaceae bacterium]|nr:response regulator [Dongiaceae bacterium]
MVAVNSPSEAAALAAILIVDDDLEDVQFIKRAFKKNNVANPLFSVFSGEEALDFLRRCDNQSRTYPGLILLDLNMPGVGGMETLRRVKQNERWRQIPAVIFTTSKAEEDVLTSYSMGANSFISKPFGFEGLTDVVAQISSYWLGVAALPSKTAE